MTRKVFYGVMVCFLFSFVVNAEKDIEVKPKGETHPVQGKGDAADDPAIWIHPQDASLSVIIGTDKTCGLYVYDLDGKEIQFVPIEHPNNVDLRYDFPLGKEKVDLVVTGDRKGNFLCVYKVNPKTRKLEDVSARKIKAGAAYGTSMYQSHKTGRFYVFLTRNMVEQWELFDNGQGKVDARLARRFDVGTLTEGCVADDEKGYFYIAEEDVGIWRYGAEPEDGSKRIKVDSVGDKGHLVADAEGLTLYYGSNGAGYLIASSQGNNKYVIYKRNENNDYVATFKIVDGGAVDGTSDTDGLDVTNVNMGKLYPEGFFIVQDGKNDKGHQNFKLTPWGSIARSVSPHLIIDTSTTPRKRALEAPAPKPDIVFPLSDGLVSYWSFEDDFENKDGVLRDRNIFNYNGKASGAVKTEKGFLSKGLSFNATESSAILSGHRIFNDILRNDWSLNFWAYPRKTGSRQMLVCKSSKLQVEFTKSGKIRIALKGNKNAKYTKSGMGTLPLNKWSMLTLVFTNDKASLYINGKESGVLNAEAPLAMAGSLQVGGYGRILPFDGIIDEVAVWKRPLPEGDIQKLYNNGDGLRLKK